MAWKLNKDLLQNHTNPIERDLYHEVGESVISKIFTEETGELDYLQLKSGEYVYRKYNEDWDEVETVSSMDEPQPGYWLVSDAHRMDYFIQIELEGTPTPQYSEEYYTFLGDKYYTKEELVKAIESYSETEDGGVYYYHHHKVEEHTLEIAPYKEVSGEYDQTTLDKVNEILKSNGIDFVVKGEQ